MRQRPDVSKIMAHFTGPGMFYFRKIPPGLVFCERGHLSVPDATKFFEFNRPLKVNSTYLTVLRSN